MQLSLLLSLWCVVKFVELSFLHNPGKKTLASSFSLSLKPKETEDNAFSLWRLQFLSLHSCCEWQLMVFWLIWNSWCTSHKAQTCAPCNTCGLIWCSPSNFSHHQSWHLSGKLQQVRKFFCHCTWRCISKHLKQEKNGFIKKSFSLQGSLQTTTFLCEEGVLLWRLQVFVFLLHYSSLSCLSQCLHSGR